MGYTNACDCEVSARYVIICRADIHLELSEEDRVYSRKVFLGS